MAEKMSKVKAIRDFFQREDEIAPEGGRKVNLQELKELSDEDKDELGTLCAEQLGAEIEIKKVA
jgi:hypothetical protein